METHKYAPLCAIHYVTSMRMDESVYQINTGGYPSSSDITQACGDAQVRSTLRYTLHGLLSSENMLPTMLCYSLVHQMHSSSLKHSATQRKSTHAHDPPFRLELSLNEEGNKALIREERKQIDE